jgi:hypothetical protein
MCSIDTFLYAFGVFWKSPFQQGFLLWKIITPRGAKSDECVYVQSLLFLLGRSYLTICDILTICTMLRREIRLLLCRQLFECLNVLVDLDGWSYCRVYCASSLVSVLSISIQHSWRDVLYPYQDSNPVSLDYMSINSHWIRGGAIYTCLRKTLSSNLVQSCEYPNTLP